MNYLYAKRFWIGVFAQVALLALLAVGVAKSAVGGRHFLPQVLALACMVILGVLDALVRLRLKKVGEQFRPFQQGLFNHARYLRLRRQHHWSGWPVYLIWVVWLAGIGLMLLNLLYNTVPRHAGF